MMDMKKNQPKNVMNSLCIEGYCNNLNKDNEKISCKCKCKEFWEEVQGYTTVDNKHIPCKEYKKEDIC